MAAPDRLQLLLAQNVVTAIDFVYVDATQTVLDVFFLRDPLTLTAPLASLTVDQIRIFSPSDGGEVPLVALAFAVVDGRNVLRLTAAFPGDFSRYRLVIDDTRIDHYPYPDENGRRRDEFSFKANCPSDLDCKPPGHECPVDEAVDFPVDYTARDFWSLRRALLDFASQRYPDWKDRLEADLGVMLAELMSAVGDEMAYVQDRIGREAYLETAAERRSLRRHARLVDYTVHDGRGASGWLDVTVDPAQVQGNIAAGDKVWEADRRVVFEVGRGLSDAGTLFNVRASRNELAPHLWDEDDTCLPVGSTVLFVVGHHVANLAFDDPPADPTGKWVVLQTRPMDPGVQARAHLVRLVAVEDLSDPVLGISIARLVWEESQATPFELDLETLVVRANIIPATDGETLRTQFRIGAGALAPEAVERRGPNGTVAYLSSLPGSDVRHLVWLGGEPERRRPEVRLHEATLVGTTWVTGDEWQWRRSLVGVSSSVPNDEHFVLDDGTWSRTVGFRRPGEEIAHVDYRTEAGATVRFGDGEFGEIPAAGTVFQATYRLHAGKLGNVAADSLTGFDAGAWPFVTAVTNPIAASGALDPETAEEVRRLAPDAFRAITYRAVTPEDYAEAAERLDWVERAGGAFRWTGSWLTAFVTPDPKGTTALVDEQRMAVTQQLDRFRQTGREAYTLDPIYADLDLEIMICVDPSAYPGEVKRRVLEALFGRRGRRGLRPTVGFFSPDNFTFGTPLERSRLEAVIQSVTGVRAVEGIQVRRRGFHPMRPFKELTYLPGANEVIRLENDALLPERGSVRLVMEGGA